MSRVLRVAIAFTLIVAIVAGGLLSAGCGKSKAALVMPTIELFQFSKGATVDFDDATINSAANAEANVKYGTAKAIYHSVWAANQDIVAKQVFGEGYWKGPGDGKTYYSWLSSGDQTAVDTKIFTDNLTQAEQDKVTEAVAGMFSGYDEELAAAKDLNKNTAFGILFMADNSSTLIDWNGWLAEAQAWMTALNNWAVANKGAGKTFAGLSYADRALAMSSVFAKGEGTINPEYAFWKAMVKNNFRNGIAASANLALAENISQQTYGQSYAVTALDCVKGPAVNAILWGQIDVTAKATADATVAYMVDNQTILDGVFASKGMTTAQAGFDAEVAASPAGQGIKMELAFYKWMAYEGLRNSFIVGYYPTVLGRVMATSFAGKTYTAMNKCEQGAVNAALFAALDPYEQGFANSVIAGLWGKVQAEMTDAIAMDQTSLIRGPTGLQASNRSASIVSGTAVINPASETCVINWKKDVDGGMTVPAAYYRWLAKESLLALKGLGTLIRLSEAEFLFKVTNTNKYPIKISNASYSFYVNSTAITGTTVKVDTAKVVASDDIWVPAESDLLVSVRAPVKQMGIITWLVVGGQSTPNAQKLAADVWSQYQAGTQTWIIQIDTKVSNDKGENPQPKSYTL